MAIFLRRKGYIFFRPQTLVSVFFQRNNCTLAEGDMGENSVLPPVDTSKWKKINATAVGIKGSMISPSSWTVLRVLRNQGFEAYLVGGCVRDLILNRVPKDFDVITTANLKEIRRQFNRAQIVGKRFPICHVWIRGSITEVSSFDTVAQTAGDDENDIERGEGKGSVPENAEENEKLTLPKMLRGCNEKDINRWRNSMHRDFTINSLFFDPFDFKIYDYSNGIEDLKALRLRTLIPAQLSFEEDCARILRGLRIAARLDLLFSKDIETAIPKFVYSIASLGPVRLMMEMNYMLSYGAAGPSILLLRKFSLLEPLLPFQAAYLEQASKASPLRSTMLMRLLSNVDKLVFCDQPADCRLWIALLAFHTALVRDPQDALVISAFGSVLYHGHWKEAIRYAREHEKSLARFSPEVSESSVNRSDEELAEAVAQFTFLLQDSINVLTGVEELQEVLSLYPGTKHWGRVFIPKRKAKEVAGAFDELVTDIESYESGREGDSINYLSLGKGDPCEIRFVLGKVILDTMTEPVAIQQGATKTQHDKKRSQSNVVHNKQREAIVPEPKQKPSKRPKPDDNSTAAKKITQHVPAPDKKNDKSTPPDLGNNHHQKDTKRGQEPEAAVHPERRRKTWKKIKQEELTFPAGGGDAICNLLNKIGGRSDTAVNEPVNVDTSLKTNKCKRPAAAVKLSGLFK